MALRKLLTFKELFIPVAVILVMPRNVFSAAEHEFYTILGIKKCQAHEINNTC